MGESSEVYTTSITSGPMSLKIDKERPKKLRLSCFHDAGAEVESSILAELGRPMWKDIMKFYEEAFRRLPVADMPKILACVVRGGHCIGLLDPVSNIILNALNLLCRRQCGGGSVGSSSSSRNTKGKRSCAAQVSISISSSNRSKRKEEKEKGPPAEPSWQVIALDSYNGLIAFMRTYFRYLSEEQARSYLRLASADLAVAVQLGKHQQFTPEDRQTTGAPDLHCGRTLFALKVAATIAEHPVPDDLARLAALVVPYGDRTPLAAVLEKGRPLSVDDINGILRFLRLQHYAASPAVQVTFQRSPQPTDMEIRSLFGQQAGGKVLEAGGQHSHFFCAFGENHVADVVVSRRDGPVCSTFDLRTPEEMKKLLAACLEAASTTIEKYSPVDMPRDPITAADSTTCKCDHTRYLKACLADTVHALYIKAVSLLPHKTLHKHLRGILVAGHCYGPMDPVSNIILNAIWYDSMCPLLEIDAEIEPDILDSQSMLRIEIRSLDSLVALVCTATGFSEHEAVEYLCYKQCDFSAVLQLATNELCYKAYDCAGLAGKHPQHSELASFLMSMAHNKVFKDTLLTNEAMGTGHVISDAVLEKVYNIMEDRSSLPSAAQPRLSPPAWKMLASRKDDFTQKQKFVGQVLEALLVDYSNAHPWEPVPRLDVICGLKKDDRGHSKLYHVNFLVQYDDVSLGRVLFFAEVWDSSFQAKRSKPITSVNLITGPCARNGCRVESTSQFVKVYSKSSRKEQETSFCCPLPYYSPDHPYLGRCTICEPVSSKIVHPPSGNHSGAKFNRLGELFDHLNLRDYNPSAANKVTESDFVYFDCHRDAKFAEVLNDGRSPDEKTLKIR